MTFVLQSIPTDVDIASALAERFPEINGAEKPRIIEGVRARCERILAALPDSSINLIRQVELEVNTFETLVAIEELHTAYTAFFEIFGGTPMSFEQFYEQVRQEETSLPPLTGKTVRTDTLRGRINALKELEIKPGDILRHRSDHLPHTVIGITQSCLIRFQEGTEFFSPVRLLSFQRNRESTS